MRDLFQTMGGGVGAVVILSALTTCIVVCAIVVYDTTVDTIRTLRTVIKNRKTKK
jgi:hypothetical protein